MGIDQKAALIFRRIEWSAEAADHLRGVASMAPHVSVDHYADMIDTGAAVLFGAFIDGEHVASAVAGFEDGDLGSEFVIYGAAGKAPGIDLIVTILPAFEAIARSGGAVSIRFHTVRKGLIARTLPAGYEAAEIIMRKVL